MNAIKRVVLGGTVALLSLPALAEPIPLDVTAGTAQLGEVSTAMLAIGAVLFGLSALAIGIKWVKASFFG